MKKGKATKKKARVVADKYEEEGSTSDDEMPEVISNATAKADQEGLNKEVERLKQQIRQAEKAKRRLKQEIFIEQKKKKLSRQPEDADDEKGPEDVPASEPEQPKKPVNKKVYPSLNISVEPLTKVRDSRASAALDFKSRRLAKAPRESVKNAVISYNKKLEVRK